MILTLTSLINLNQKIYPELQKIAQHPLYSQIRIQLKDDCPIKELIQECNMDSCDSKELKKSTDDFYDINLIRVPEVNTGYKEGAREVWKTLTNLSSDRNYRTFLSGIHYSVSVHISKFYSKFFNIYRSNFDVYKLKCSKDFYENFIKIYKFLILAFSQLKNLKSEIQIQKINEIKKIQKIIENELKNHKSEIHIQKTEEIKKMIETELKIKINNYVEIENVLRNAINILPCLSCKRCQLWSKIQFTGLIGAIKILYSPKKLKKDELIFFINLVKLFSESMIFDEEMKMNISKLNGKLGTFYKYKDSIYAYFISLFFCIFIYKCIKIIK